MKTSLFIGTALAAGLVVGAGASAQTLAQVQSAGVLKCGVNTGLAGFAAPDAAGNWEGFDVAVCRALAAAVLGDANKVDFTPTTGETRFTALASGEIDVSTFYPDSVGRDPEQIELASVLLLAKTATVIAYLQRRAQGEDLIEPRRKGAYVDEFMRLAFAPASGELDLDPVIKHALDVLLILHGDHEQNCSTSTVRIVGSSQANIYASVSAGIGALSGPLHGGANEAALRMFDGIKESGDTVEQFVAKVKDKAEGARLMGFGHRVYKSYDPRGAVVKRVADDVLAKLGGDNETFAMAQRLEEIALSDEYFIERKLYPNVDFYTGLLYSAIGFPTTMFTPLFALGRMPGWVAHYREMLTDPRTKIGRPRQIYVGEVERDYVPLADRH